MKLETDDRILLSRETIVADPGGGSRGPDPAIRPDACFGLEFLHRQDRISFFFFFLMKRAFHFATKLNSRDIKKLRACLQGERVTLVLGLP